MVPNLVAEYEARSSAHNVMQRPHMNMGPSIPSASDSRQVSKDLPSQDFPTVVPAALPSNSSSKSIKIPLPISGDASAISLERHSTVMNQKEKIYKDPPPNSAYSQHLQGNPSKTVQPARVEPVALHAPIPFDRDGMNYNGKYHEPQVSNTMQTPRIPHSEKRTEESVKYNPEWSAQPSSTMNHGAKTMLSSRALWPVEVLPSTTLQREVSSDHPHAALPSSRDDWSGGKVSQDASGAGHGAKPREMQPDAPHAVGRLTPQASIPKQIVDARIPPFTVQEHKAGHGKPSGPFELAYQLN